MKNLMLHQFDDPHSAHKVFGDSVNCDYMHFEKLPNSEINGNLGNLIFRVRQGVLSSRYHNWRGECYRTEFNGRRTFS